MAHALNSYETRLLSTPADNGDEWGVFFVVGNKWELVETADSKIRAKLYAFRRNTAAREAAGEFPNPSKTYHIFNIYDHLDGSRRFSRSAEIDLPSGAFLMGQKISGPDWPVFITEGYALAVREDLAEAFTGVELDR